MGTPPWPAMPGPPYRPVPVPPAPARPPAKPSAGTVFWALVPFISIGMLTPVIIGHAALRLRSTAVVISAGLYTAAVAVLFVGSNTFGSNPPAWVNGAIAVSVFASWAGGTVQAFALRRRVFTTDPTAEGNRAVREAALRRHELRTRAREIVTENPALAYELLIGRPDLPRAYDDGGLIAVNQVPAHCLTALPGIDAPAAERIVELRAQRGPFVSGEDLLSAANLPPHLLDHLAEYAVFLY